MKTANKLTGAENEVSVKVKGGETVVIRRQADGLWYAPGVAPHRNLRIVRTALLLRAFNK